MTDTMLILRGISGHFAGKDWPHGALDEPSALEYARRSGYVGKVLDYSGETGPTSAQTLAALREFRKDPGITALYGFSGGGYNVRHILNALTPDEKARLKKLVVLGAPNNPASVYAGAWELVYRKDPPGGHMDGPRALLAELPEPAGFAATEHIPLEGLAFDYTIGSSTPQRGAPGRAVEVSYDALAAAAGPRIAYCNLFDENNTGVYAPYRKKSDTAAEYNEGEIDPAGPGWEKNLREQFERRRKQGFEYVELDNPDAYSVAEVIGAVKLAQTYGLKVICKNPLLMSGDPTPYIALCHAVIVERGAGNAAAMDVLRRKAGKPDMPVWFVAFTKGAKDGLPLARAIAVEAKHYCNMSVTHSPDGEYTSVVDILLPNAVDTQQEHPMADDKQASKTELGQKVKRAMLSLGYPWFDDQNVVSVEGMDPDGKPNKNRVNAFEDIKMVLNGAGEIIGGPWWATTMSGEFWTKNRMDKRGAFDIDLGPQSIWTPGEYHGNIVWRQAEDSHIRGFRDNAEDFTRHGLPQLYPNIGVHHHGGGDQARLNIGKRAAGCQVIDKDSDQAEFMHITLACPRYLADKKGYRLTATVLKAEWVLDGVAAVTPPPKEAPKPEAPKTPETPAPQEAPVLISEEAIDLIVATEDGDIDNPSREASRKQYEASYRHPEWPGGGSGVTIGIGYDVGAGVKDKAQLWADWKGLIPDAMITALEPAIGVTGASARNLTVQLKPKIDIPWDAAIAVFMNVDVPRWYKRCAKHLPNFEELSPDCKGALVSLAYNRGDGGFDDSRDRYKEMRAIKAHMVGRRFDRIPGEFRAMKRIWAGSGLSGLLTRRDREADLFERGLKAPSAPRPAPQPAPSVAVEKAPQASVATASAVAGIAGGGVGHWLGGGNIITTVMVAVAVVLVVAVIVHFVRKSKGS